MTHTIASLTKLLKQCRNSVETHIDVAGDTFGVGVAYYASLKDLLDTIDALPDATPAQPVPLGGGEVLPMYLCPAGCGCAWRDNLNGTMSLYDENQRSCTVCETLPLKTLVPVPMALGEIEKHLYIDQRHDGLWLVCVQKQYDTRFEAQVACRSWMQHYKNAVTNAAQPLQHQHQDGKDAPDDARMVLIQSLVASKGWNHGYASAFVDDWFHERAAIASTKGAV